LPKKKKERKKKKKKKKKRSISGHVVDLDRSPFWDDSDPVLHALSPLLILGY
jgi:hypothetical protein